MLEQSINSRSLMIIANVVWPSLYLLARINALWIIGISLVVEFLVLAWLIRGKIWRIGLMTLVMNLISTIIGIIGIPLSGFMWELIATVTIQPIFKWNTFNLVTWIVSCILAALLNTVVEMMTLDKIFKVPWSVRTFVYLAIANGITVSLAYRSIILNPPTGSI